MTEREALKLALDAFGEIAWSNETQWQRDRAKEAITVIKEALANVATNDTSQERVDEIQKQRHEQEPVAKNEEGRITWLMDDWPQNCFLYAEPPKWTPVEIGVDVTNDGAHVVGMYVLPDAVRYVFYSEFHSAPQRTWVGLTDEEVEAMQRLAIDPVDANGWWFLNRERYANLIEAKLKEKNCG